MRNRCSFALGLALAATLAACASGSSGSSGTQSASAGAAQANDEAACRKQAEPNISGANPPTLITGEQPDSAQLASKSGYACVRVTISASGSVVDPRVVQTDNDEFARAFVRALADWKYEPATRGTAKVPYHTVLFARLPG